MSIQWVATLCLAGALIHTFSVRFFHRVSRRFEINTVGHNFFRLLGEVEVVFGIWASFLIAAILLVSGKEDALRYLETRNFTEPAFVFVVMVVCSTRPILSLASLWLGRIASWLPLPEALGFFLVVLTLGPLLGSFITEPAAMTVTALLLSQRFFSHNLSSRLKYATLGLLFVNVSIGGVLTPYAAPPILMVAATWKWDLSFMLTTFGWKGALACLISTTAVAALFRKELTALPSIPFEKKPQTESPIPVGVTLVHLFFLAAIVILAHSLVAFIGLFLFFLGLVSVTRQYHHDLKLREGLLVAFFLGGLVVLGGLQNWWLEPILSRLSESSLFFSSVGLTSITDNAALTYLGSQVPSLSEVSRYALVAGSVVGGGLTVIANAPNPAGYGILNRFFGPDGISPVQLFLYALGPTLISAFVFWFT